MRPLKSHFPTDALTTLDPVLKQTKEARILRRAQAVRRWSRATTSTSFPRPSTSQLYEPLRSQQRTRAWLPRNHPRLQRECTNLMWADLAGNNTPIFFVHDPRKFQHCIHLQKRHPVTNRRDHNMQWDFWTLSLE